MSFKRAILGTTVLSGVLLGGLALPALAQDLHINGDTHTVAGTEDYVFIDIGITDPDGHLIVPDGTTLNSDYVNFGKVYDASGNTATVSGDWYNSDYMFLGDYSPGNTLTVESGGYVEVDGVVWIGSHEGASGNALIVDGGTFDANSDLIVGLDGSGNSMTIQSGGDVTGVKAVIGNNSFDNFVLVTGSGSTWDLSDQLYVGNLAGAGDNSLTIEKGGDVSIAKDMLVGATDQSDYNSVLITGSGSSLTLGASSTLYVGRGGDQNSLTVADGATLTTLKNTRVGGSSGNNGPSNYNTLTVTGAGSVWDATGTLRIGDASDASWNVALSPPNFNPTSHNSVIVESGGVVNMGDTTFIGFTEHDSYNSLVVTGSGSQFSSDSDILVGAANYTFLRPWYTQADHSLLEVTSGGSVSTQGILVIGGNDSRLQVGATGSVSAVDLYLDDGSTLGIGLNGDDGPTIAVTNKAYLASDLEVDIGAAGITRNRYTVLTADFSVLGFFGQLSMTGYADNFTVATGYTPKEAYLTFTADLGKGVKLDQNQQNVAGALDDYFNRGGTLNSGLGVLYTQTGDQLKTSLSQVSGEAGATGGVNAIERATDSFLGLLMGGSMVGPDGVLGSRQAAAAAPQTGVVPTADVPPAPAGGGSLWGGVYGGLASLPGDNGKGSHDTDTNVGGIAAGWDYDVTADTRLGLALAGGRTSWDLDQGLGSGDSTFIQLGGYGTQRFGASYLSVAAAYAWHSMSTDRKVTVDGTENIDADFNASNLAGRIEGGHRFGDSIGLTPYAAFQAQAVYMPGYREHGDAGGDGFALSYDSNTATALRSELGLGIDTSFATGTGRLFARAAWAHDWNSDANVQASFAALNMSTFTVNGAEAPDDLALITAGAEFGLSEAASLAATFDGEFGADYESYAASLTLRYGL